MTEKTFPVLWQGTRDLMRRLEALGCPRAVPWAFIAERSAECLRYHDQTPERLAERGGLAPEEILVVLESAPLTTSERLAMWNMPAEQSVPRLKDALEAWDARRSSK
jgi:hypothetical protein